MNKEEAEKQLHQMFDDMARYDWIKLHWFCYVPLLDSHLYIEDIDWGLQRVFGMAEDGERYTVLFENIFEVRHLTVLDDEKGATAVWFEHKDEDGNWVR